MVLVDTHDEQYITNLKKDVQTKLEQHTTVPRSTNGGTGHIQNLPTEVLYSPSIQQKIWLTALLEFDGSWGIYPYVRSTDNKKYYNFRISLVNTNPKITQLLYDWYGGTLYSNKNVTKFHRKRTHEDQINMDKGVQGILWQNSTCMQVIYDLLPYTVLTTEYFTFMQKVYNLYEAREYRTVEKYCKMLPAKCSTVGVVDTYDHRGLQEYIPAYIGGLFDAKGSIKLSIRNGRKEATQLNAEIRIRCKNTSMQVSVSRYLYRVGIHSTQIDNTSGHNTLCIVQKDSVLRFLETFYTYMVCKREFVVLTLDYRHFFIERSVKMEHYYIIHMLKDYWQHMRRGVNIREARTLLPDTV